MFTCSLSSLLDCPACQVGGKKVLLHALEETSQILHEAQDSRGHREEAGPPVKAGRELR